MLTQQAVTAGWQVHPTNNTFAFLGQEVIPVSEANARFTAATPPVLVPPMLGVPPTPAVPAPATDMEGLKLYEAAKNGKLTSLDWTKAEKLLATKQELHPSDFVVTGTFAPEEQDAATIVPTKNGDTVRVKTTNTKSGVNVFIQLQSTAKTKKNGQPFQYAVSILNGDQMEVAKSSAIIQTIAVELPKRATDSATTPAAVVMNFA